MDVGCVSDFDSDGAMVWNNNPIVIPEPAPVDTCTTNADCDQTTYAGGCCFRYKNVSNLDGGVNGDFGNLWRTATDGNPRGPVPGAYVNVCQANGYVQNSYAAG